MATSLIFMVIAYVVIYFVVKAKYDGEGRYEVEGLYP